LFKQEIRNVYKIFVSKLEERGPVGGNLRLGGMIILEWILEKYCGKEWTGFIWLRIRTNGRLL